MNRAMRSQISGGARCEAGSSTKWICAHTFTSAPSLPLGVPLEVRAKA